ncbi:magnesium transporter [Novosphingobium sp.]|uniref:magnesium transporter n=1 Tax=Novosphingobium sp. TaxID=1874826 RepID=UPI0022C04D19|nr:magnesium transporter [Novosphingobium sp.]MCZ8019842.1 magnesium transporter [Novosphingobium sp.]MCZ8035832.1 magnesium transporter [Novosphingobium sp.]MCZ8052709.1 magnesium transporter [Novosphingobium sp.]MCZ8060813.1 magnesium transporter [Novosphingobium sp.]MCZ8233385.1 magnesium transporter [Novosphingobium sp.]
MTVDKLDPDLLESAALAAEPAVESESLDAENTLKPEFVRRVRDSLEAGENDAVYGLVEGLHPADIADLFELLDADERPALAAAISDLMGSEVYAELNDYVREDIVEQLPAETVADIAEQLDTDDAVAMLEDLDEEDQQAVLAEMEPEDRAVIEAALSYPEESAGRLMSRDFVAVPEHMTVGDLIDFLREGHDLANEFWEVFIVDARFHPLGTCALSWILRTPRHIALTDVMQRDQTLIPVTMDQEEVALRFQKYALISAAVVDADGRLVGQITVDDVVHIIQEEAGEDVLLLSGAGEGDINEPIRDSYVARVRWLIANLATALLGATIISNFGGAIEKLVALAALSPMVASIGGNAGTQTMAVAVRALATNQLTRSNTRRILWRELRVALLNGVTVATLIGAATGLVFANPLLGAVIGTAVVVNIITAGLAGVLVPVTLDRLGQDPAVASSVFVTMITDSMGFFAFLGLAVASGLVG